MTAATRELSKLGIEVVRLRNEDTLRQPDASWEWIACAVAECDVAADGQVGD